MAHLAAVLEGRKDVPPPQQLDVCVRAVSANLLDEILEANHENRCLIVYRAVAKSGHFGGPADPAVALTCLFFLHYTGPVSAPANFAIRGLNAIVLGRVAGR